MLKLGEYKHFKNDKYKKARGGRSRWLMLHCEKCKNKIALYQKDGPGILKRLYLDRIFSPEELANKDNKKLICKKCKTLLGVQDVYEKENRLVYRLFAGAVSKKIYTEN
ncbi:MAG: hypothetical protein AAB575_02185 [Patescibacteria group bacterium]